MSQTKLDKVYYAIEKVTDSIIPYCLIALIGILIIDIFFVEIAHKYQFISYIDYFIVTVFCLDLLCKFHKTKHLADFFKHYWLDIIAVFPFFLLFRTIELVRGFSIIAGESTKEIQSFIHVIFNVEKEFATAEKLAKFERELVAVERLTRAERFARFLRPIIGIRRTIHILFTFEEPTAKHWFNPKESLSTTTKIKKNK
jgi:hypothetical protein